MRICTRGIASWLRRRHKPAVMGSMALLLALSLACGASDQPQTPAQPAGQASQVEPAQPSSPSQGASESAAVDQSNVTGQNAEAMPTPTKLVPADTGAQESSEPMVVKEVTPEQPAAPEAMMDKATEPAAQPEPMVKAVEAQPEPAAEPTAAPAAQQEQTSPRETQPTEAPAVVVVPAPAADPEPTEAPAPAVVPEPTEAPAATPVPVVVEPQPDFGNEVGNRIPAVALQLYDGTTISTDGLIEGGKPTFLFFTSTT